MKCDKHTMLLYAVTDRAWVGEQTLYQQVESALKGGATCVQLREKHLDDADFLQEAIEIHALCQLNAMNGIFLIEMPSFSRHGSLAIKANGRKRGARTSCHHRFLTR